MNDSNFNYTGTDSIRIKPDCDFCRNAYTCDELSHDNDLSYMSCGIVDKGYRMLFRSGGKATTELIVEQLCVTGLSYNHFEWVLVGRFIPNYCPFCGRRLVENMLTRRNKNV